MADSVRQSHAHDVNQEADDETRNMDRLAINFNNLPLVSNPGPSARPCFLMVLEPHNTSSPVSGNMFKSWAWKETFHTLKKGIRTKDNQYLLC